MSDAEHMVLRARRSFYERAVAMAIVASLTLPAFGIRAYQTRVLEDPYGAEDRKDRTDPLEAMKTGNGCGRHE